MVREIEVQSQIGSYQRLKKWYLIPPCLTLSIITYISRVKWSNPGEEAAPSPTAQCSSYWKGCLWVTFKYSRQLYFAYEVFSYLKWLWTLLSYWILKHSYYNKIWSVYLIGFTLLYFKIAVIPLVPETKMVVVSKLISLGNLLVRKVTWFELTTMSATLILSHAFGADCMTRIAYIYSRLARTHSLKHFLFQKQFTT